MRIRTLQFTGDFLVSMLKEGNVIQAAVVSNGLPADARFVRAGHDYSGSLYLVIESASFDDIEEGDEIPAHPKVGLNKIYPEP